MQAESNQINSKKDLKEWLNYECRAYLYDENEIINLIRYIFPVSERDILRKHQILLRKTEYYQNSCKKIFAKLYKFRLLRLQNKYSLHIPVNTCGKGLKIMHLGPILLNGKAVVGNDCAFHINTALVARGTDDGAPRIGNGVVIGIGAILLGNIYIADNIAIGANSVVNKSFDEPNIAIAGAPAKKISNNGRSRWNQKN